MLATDNGIEKVSNCDVVKVGNNHCGGFVQRVHGFTDHSCVFTKFVHGYSRLSGENTQLCVSIICERFVIRCTTNRACDNNLQITIAQFSNLCTCQLFSHALASQRWRFQPAQ